MAVLPAARSTYSWEGEDVLVAKVFTDLLKVPKGVYVDVGAHHPHRMSNTQLLYERGWRGVNIDAMPGSMVPFNAARPEDVNIECGVAAKAGELRFSRFDNPALNGFLPDLEVQRQTRRGCKLLDQIRVAVRNINDLLTEVEQTGRLAGHVRATAPAAAGPVLRDIAEAGGGGTSAVGLRVDFLNVDIEGLDLEILQSLDLSRWRPKGILVEILGCTDVQSVQRSPMCVFLESLGFGLFSRLHFSSLFVDRKLYT
jgi:hypothetical protein